MAAAVNGTRRPSAANRHPTAPSVLTMNNHFANVDSPATKDSYKHGVQVISSDKEFNPNLQTYLALEKILPAGFNYHLISVFGSQSTGKSTLLNHLFGTEFGVMSEQERRQTTKGIWLSKNQKEKADGEAKSMAENILVMDVEGTDGRERGEDQDFERKSALFALATSEVLIVNIWEHQVGLYQGANMGLLKTVFEVNLQLFLKDQKSVFIHSVFEQLVLISTRSVPRSLLFFVIRDHIGHTPLINLQNTLLSDLSRIWQSISKPAGLENSRIEDYFDFAFAALPHKLLQPERFVEEAGKLGKRFREGYKDVKRAGLQDESQQGILLPEYHRRIPADGFPFYASNVWEQIDSNKDLDLPTQQELLAQFRCDEIAREVLVAFDEAIIPLESKQGEGIKTGRPVLIAELGGILRTSRVSVMKNFQAEASRYHKAVYKQKLEELQKLVDGRLSILFQGQLSTAHKVGIKEFSDAVSDEVRQGQKRKDANYDFAEIVATQKKKALFKYETEAQGLAVEGASWSDYTREANLFKTELDEASARLRRDEMRRLAIRVEQYVKSRLDERVSLEFNSTLGSSRELAAAGDGGAGTEKELWDRVWHAFTDTVSQAETRFTARARGFDASSAEVEVGLWRLRRKAWAAMRSKLDVQTAEGSLLTTLRENFEDKFRYDADGVPRIWRPTDDIEGIYTAARHSTLALIPLLAKFRLAATGAPPPLDAWLGAAPAEATAADEEDLTPIGGVDDEAGGGLDEECTILADARAAELAARFKKQADAVYVEAKRSAIGGITQVPLYFYGLLLALGWNELVALLRNPLYFIMLGLLAAGSYMAWRLNLIGPMVRMADAASRQGLEVAKERLREFLEASEQGALASGGSRRSKAVGEGQAMEMSSGVNGGGKRQQQRRANAAGEDGDPAATNDDENDADEI